MKPLFHFKTKHKNNRMSRVLALYHLWPRAACISWQKGPGAGPGPRGNRALLGSHFGRCWGWTDGQNEGRGVDRQAWGSDRHMPSTLEINLQDTHTQRNSPEPRHGTLRTTVAAGGFKLGLWLRKQGKSDKFWLTVPNLGLQGHSLPFAVG